METTKEDQSGNKVKFFDIYIYLTSVWTYLTGLLSVINIPTSRTAMTPFHDGMILISLGGAPLLSIRISSCGAAVLQFPLLISEGKYTRLAFKQMRK